MTGLRRRRLAAATVAIALAGVGLWSVGSDGMARAVDVAPAVSPEQLATVEGLSEVFRAVARSVQPAVVQITTRAEAKRESRRSGRRGIPEDLPAPFREFFEERGFRFPEPPTRQGSGSGVIVDAAKGFILTNNHVVGGGDGEELNVRIDVRLADGRWIRNAKVVGRDPNTDLALIQITADNLKSLPIGDSDKVQVGDWVLAIGAPFGLDQTVTQGIISAKGRSNVGIVALEDFIQTDAAINPGNSGGPLVNMRGELIGINTAIATSGGVRGYMGVGFAIPTSMIRQLLPDLEAGREIARGYLGVKIEGLENTIGLAKTFGLKEDKGVLVQEVFSDPPTPASKAGLKAEDVILAFNDKELTSADELRKLVAATKPGTEVRLRVWRDGKEITIPVVIEKQPKDFYTWGGRGEGRGGGGGEDEETGSLKLDALGITVRPVTQALAQEHGWEYDEVKGMLIVTEVESLGEAAAMAVRPGDLIVSVQGKPVKTLSALKQALSPEALAEGVRIRIRGEYGTRTLLFQISP